MNSQITIYISNLTNIGKIDEKNYKKLNIS